MNLNTMIEQRTIVLPESGRTIKIRPILVKEEKILLMADESQKDSVRYDAITHIITNCTMGNVDMKSLSYNDFSYIFVQLRIISRGESIKLDLTCGEEKCNTLVQKEYSLSEILNIDGKDQKPYIELEGGFGISVVPATADYTRNLMSRQETDKSLENPSLAMIDLIQNHITGVLKGEEKFPLIQGSQEAIDFIESLTSVQLEKIVDWYTNGKKPLLKIEWTCEKCKKANKIEQTNLLSFFAL